MQSSTKTTWNSIFCCTAPLLLGVLLTHHSAAAEVTIERSDNGAIIQVDGELFAEYLILAGNQPAIWPIIGPTGKPITRSYPIGPLLETEVKDHPHHRSLWFSHQRVNGHDFWSERRDGKRLEPRTLLVKHLGFDKIESCDGAAVLVARNRWIADGDPICEDERTWTFGADDNARWIDLAIKIIASHGDVTFGDIKDGTFSIRVAGTMKVDAKLGGKIVNSRGQVNTDAWAMPAEWVDYVGSLEGETVGIAMFSHPSNFRHPCRWHVRNYGLFTANPFGEEEFPKSEVIQGGVTIPSGDSLTLRYRVFFHRGNTEQGNVAQAYEKYAASGPAGRLPIILDEDFGEDIESGTVRWTTTDREQSKKMWSIATGADGNRVLRVAGESSYRPPHRSPRSIALLKDVVVGDFELTAKIQNTNVDAGPHRDLCFFWGYQDPSHFYYVHLGARPDPHSCQIFIVNDAPRAKITLKESTGTPWTNDWHDVKIVRDVESGAIEVYFDDMQTPVMTANDKTFTWGRVGVGTFDDNGNFDNLRLRGNRVDPIPEAAEVP